MAHHGAERCIKFPNTPTRCIRADFTINWYGIVPVGPPTTGLSGVTDPDSGAGAGETQIFLLDCQKRLRIKYVNPDGSIVFAKFVDYFGTITGPGVVSEDLEGGIEEE